MAYDPVVLSRYAKRHPLHRRYEELRALYRAAGEAMPIEWRTINYFEDWAKAVRLGRHDRLSPALDGLPSPRNYSIRQTKASAANQGRTAPRSVKHYRP